MTVALTFPAHTLAFATAHGACVIHVSAPAFRVTQILFLALAELTNVALLAAKNTEEDTKGGQALCHTPGFAKPQQLP